MFTAEGANLTSDPFLDKLRHAFVYGLVVPIRRLVLEPSVTFGGALRLRDQMYMGGQDRITEALLLAGR